ncbi:MAG TPA: hypothetical protein VNK73_05755 [Actinomycetota bacterium]|jgi:hypothetical protein|nr:hypothetical protein [Actinomycetota bacterium]
MAEQNDPAGPQSYDTFVVELLVDEHREIRRTRVDHVQSGVRETWPGWEEDLLVTFMLAHVLARARPAEPGSTPGTRVTSDERRAPPASTRRGHVRQAAEPGSGEALAVQVDRLTIQDIRPDRIVERQARTRLLGQVRFTVAGATARPVSTRRTPYTVQILACELTSGTTTVLASHQRRLRAGMLRYTAAVEFLLPDAGRYQLQALVLLPEVVGVTLGPVVAVTQTAEVPDG